MSAYDDDYDRPPRRGRDDRPPPPYPGSAVNDYGSQMPGPPPQQGTNVPPPPMGEQFSSGRRPSAMKRSGSASRVPHLRPEFPDEASYLGSTAPDLESKNKTAHRQFRDKRDGYESDEGEALRKAKPQRHSRQPPSSADGFEDQRRRRDPYDDRGPPPRRADTYADDRDPPPRRRGKDKGYDDDYAPRDRDKRRRDPPPDVEYGSEPIPAVRRSRSEREPRKSKPSRRDTYDDSSSEDDRRRQPPRRNRSQDDRRRRDDDDRDDRRRDRDKRRDRDRSRRRYSDDDASDYDRRDRRDRDRDRRDRRDKPPKEFKIGDFDAGPLIEKGQKHYATLAPIMTPIVMNMARKYLSDKKR